MGCRKRLTSGTIGPFANKKVTTKVDLPPREINSPNLDRRSFRDNVLPLVGRAIASRVNQTDTASIQIITSQDAI